MPPYGIEWLEDAKADARLGPPHSHAPVRRNAAFRAHGFGDINALHGEMAGAFRLRVGGYRVLFMLE